MTRKIPFLTLILIGLLLLSNCSSGKQLNKSTNPDRWRILATANDVVIFVDTTSIRQEGSVTFAIEKRVFLTPESRSLYVDKIKREYTKLNKPEKANKWNDFSYCIYYSVYECVNSRFRVLWVEDYDSTGKRIVRTSPPKGKEEWINVAEETVGDYTFFYICDFGN